VHPAYWFTGAVTKPVVYGLYRLDVSGWEHLPKAGFVVAANHVSNFDPWPLGLPMWPRRQLRFMAKAELFNPILAPLLRAGGAFKVRRGEADWEAIETAVQLCREGEVVAMCPEGTRQRKGLRKKYEARPRTGAARISLAAGVPLVPAGIHGTDRLSRLGRLAVAYGPPIPLDDLAGLDIRESSRIATERLMAEIYRLRDLAASRGAGAARDAR
jgi:1-acyl-sn-glycerol-3-phosphate acyltransferase